ncbi:MAG: tetratricopeptide repeat protein, partial [Candidatus Thorarchaeota archaeon]
QKLRLRHIMLHVGALHVRLNAVGKMPLRWVSKIPEEEGTELHEMGLYYLQNGNLSEAEKIYVELCTDSENPLFYYNLACCYSLQKNMEQSIKTLKKCLNFDQNGRFKNLAKTDKDFINMREIPEFNQLITNS